MNKPLAIVLSLVFTPLWGSETTQAAPVVRKALVIGNAKYAPGRLFGRKPLSNPRNDAVDIAQRLKSYDFQVTTLLDATSSAMRKSINAFVDKLAPDDVALIYYSGHGTATVCDKEMGIRNYLIPVGTKINSHADLCRVAVATESLLDKLQERGDGTNILVLDSCRKNLEKLEAKGIESEGFTGMYGGSGTFIGYATAPGKLALGNSEQRNSLYTQSLLKVLQPPYDKQPIETLFQQVRTLVVQEANKFNRKQVPWDANGLETSFCFHSPCRSAETVATATTTPEPVTATTPPVYPTTESKLTENIDRYSNDWQLICPPYVAYADREPQCQNAGDNYNNRYNANDNGSDNGSDNVNDNSLNDKLYRLRSAYRHRWNAHRYEDELGLRVDEDRE